MFLMDRRHSGSGAAVRFGRYSGWFLAAAIYNVGWGGLVAIEPTWLLQPVGVDVFGGAGVAWRVVGMMVLAFAPAYWWASRNPWQHRHLILIATSAKVLGLAGFVSAVATGQLPPSFGVITLMNDVVWLPAFAAFLVDCARVRGRRALLTGD
jgi:hypothetical protein